MSEALRLAQRLEILVTNEQDHQAAAAELRRLHALNAELVEVLRVAVDSDLGAKWVWHETGKEAWITHARAALAKVEASK